MITKQEQDYLDDNYDRKRDDEMENEDFEEKYAKGGRSEEWN